MSGTLKINKVTHNTISIEWKFVCANSSEKPVSVPFTMNGSNPMSYYIEYIYNPDAFSICSSRPGRGVIKCFLKYAEIKQRILKFSSNWSNSIGFKCSSINAGIEIILECDITWFGCTGDNKNEPQYSQKVVPGLYGYLENDKNPDYHIVIDGKKLPAHKLILEGHSEALGNLFRSENWEESKKEMEMKEIDYSTMQTVLKIIYTRNTEDLDDIDTALSVLKVADQWGMHIVKEICENKLQLKIQDDNVGRLLDEAGAYTASKLSYTCVEYIMARNYGCCSLEKLREMADGRPVIKDAVYENILALTPYLRFIQ